MTGPIETIIEFGLRIAASRWPESRRGSCDAEWRAELAAIRSEPGVGAVRRNVGAIRFALSLARSRVTEQPEEWPEYLARLGRICRPAILLLATPLLALFAWVCMNGLTSVGQLFGDLTDPTVGAVTDVVGTLVSASTVVLMAWLGWRGAGWLPLTAVADRLVRVGTATVVAPVLVGFGAAILLLSPLSAPDAGVSPSAPVRLAAIAVIPAMLVWAVGLGLLSAMAGRTESRRWAWLVAVTGGVVLVWLAGTAVASEAATELNLSPASAPLWFPTAAIAMADQSLLSTVGYAVHPGDPVGASVGRVLASQLGYAPQVLLGMTAFAVAYVVRHGRTPRAVSTTPAASPAVISAANPVAAPMAPAVPAIRVGRGGRAITGVAWTLVVLGVLAWADALTVAIQASPRVENAAGDAPDTAHLWLQDMRQAALVLIALSLITALRAYRSAVALAAVLAIGLLTTDLLIDRMNLEGWSVGLPVVMIALAAVAVVRLVARAIGPDVQAGTGRVRRGLWIAMLAAYVAPGIVANSTDAEGYAAMPWHLPVSIAIVGAGLVVLAGIAAASAVGSVRAVGSMSAGRVDIERDGRRRAVVAISGAGAALVLTAAMAVAGPSVLVFLVLGGPILAAFFYAVVRWPSHRTPMTYVCWIGFAVLAVVTAPVVAMASLSASSGIAPAMMLAAGYTFPADGIPYVGGAVLIGAAVALAGSVEWRRFRSRRPTNSPPARIAPIAESGTT